MVQESIIAAGYRCDSRRPQEAKIPTFVPPRPRDRRRLGKGDSRAGYWCRRTAVLGKKVAAASREAQEAKEMARVALEVQGTDLAKKVAIAKHEAREAKKMIRVAQDEAKEMIRVAQDEAKGMIRVAREAHEQQLQQLQQEMGEMKQLLATSLKQGVQQREVVQKHIADTQELLAPLVEAHRKTCRARGRSMAAQFMSVLLLYQHLHVCIDEWRINRRPWQWRWGPKGHLERRIVCDRHGFWSVRKEKWCSREWRDRVARDHAASAQ